MSTLRDLKARYDAQVRAMYKQPLAHSKDTRTDAPAHEPAREERLDLDSLPMAERKSRYDEEVRNMYRRPLAVSKDG